MNEISHNQFECDSLIKRFEFSFEMAWKLMMSYEKENGVIEFMVQRMLCARLIACRLSKTVKHG